MNMDLIFKNQNEEFELYITDVSESEHEIEVYTECLHPSLKRGWTGDIIYFAHKAYDALTASPIEERVELTTTQDVLLRSVQCFNMQHDAPTEWKYTFLKA
jgi:hypothetical protein